MRTFGFILLFTTLGMARTEFWAPVVPPRAHFSVDVKFVPDPGRLEGTETIRFRNDMRRPIGRIMLQWFGDVLRVKVNGVPAERAPGKYSVALFDLPQDLRPGGEVTLTIDFGAAWKLDAKKGSAITSYLSPHLWWGFGTLDDYEVRLHVPEGYAAATSGRYDTRTGTYRAESARGFGLFIGKGYESAEADAGDVHVRAVFTAAGRPCAELLVKTAVDVIGFYRQQFGFYPHASLSIVPGMDFPAGGYPPATALVVIHGQERFNERPEAFWRWITAHEIGHMYWSNYVLPQGPNSLSWLMIGLGLHADRAYRRAHDITGAGELEKGYVSGAKQGLDTTMDVTAEQEDAIKWDFNNVVEHGKSMAFVNALESVVGADTFARIYRRCLKDYAGKQLGWREFQRIAEIESGQDLDWLFEAWVRSSATAAYRVAGQECSPAVKGFDCTVHVERVGALRMPVSVAARFEDGSEQRFQTDRWADLDEIKFAAKSPLKDVVIDPEDAVAMAEVLPQEQQDLAKKVSQKPWTGAGEAALDAYRQGREMKVQDGFFWLKVGLLLYDGLHYPEALEAMTQAGESDAEWRFAALVWQGHLLDLLGRRAEAVARYQEALKVPGARSMQHSQYNMVIDKKWVEERLKTPFERKGQ
jgi:tetratricopeptide (TPR) repeat protein